MNHATVNSPRLRKVLKILLDGRPHSTMEIIRRAKVAAVNSIVAELRANGAQIGCRAQYVDDRRVWFYTMTKAPKT